MISNSDSVITQTSLSLFQYGLSATICMGLQGHVSAASHHSQHFEKEDPYEKLKLRIHSGMKTDAENVLEDPKVEYLVKSLFTKKEAEFLSTWPKDGKAKTTTELAHHYSLSEEEFLTNIEPLMQKHAMYKFMDCTGHTYVILMDREIACCASNVEDMPIYNGWKKD